MIGSTSSKSAVFVGCALLLVWADRSAFGWTLEELLNEPYFDRSDVEAVRKGRFGVAKIHEVSEREVAVVIACRIDVPSERALSPFLGDSLPVDEDHLLDQKLIDPASPDASFAAISLDGDDERDVRYFLDAHPGFGLNLSSDEIAAIQALSDESGPAAVEATLAELLHARYRSYAEAGLDGALPYAREDGESIRPGEELRRTGQAMSGLHELYPEFHDAWLRYPSRVSDDVVGDHFFWLKLDLEDRPTFVLSHRLEAIDQDKHLVGIRDYYVSHFFDVAQRVAVVTRLDTGEDILIYIERLWVDYWTGLASLKKKLGRKILTKQMEHLLEEHGICGT